MESLNILVTFWTWLLTLAGTVGVVLIIPFILARRYFRERQVWNTYCTEYASWDIGCLQGQARYRIQIVCAECGGEWKAGTGVIGLCPHGGCMGKKRVEQRLSTGPTRPNLFLYWPYQHMQQDYRRHRLNYVQRLETEVFGKLPPPEELS